MDTELDVSLPVAAQPGFEEVIDQGVMVEGLGYDRVWVSETWGRDAVTILATLAERTNKVGLGSAIFPVYSRSPALVAQTAATLNEASDNRFRVGLGPSGPAVIENWHGIDFGKPLRRTREYVEIVRQALSGDPVNYSGELFQLRGFRMRFEPSLVPIDVAAMGPKAVELTGRFGDGWHALMFTPNGFRERMEDLRRGAELGDRSIENFRTMLMLTCCALPDGGRARELVRQHVAFYLGGMGTYYRDALARQGYEETAHAIHDAWQNDDREHALELLDDDLLDKFAVAGTPAEARETLERFTSIDSLDAVAVSFPRAASPTEIGKTMEELAPITQ